MDFEIEGDFIIGYEDNQEIKVATLKEMCDFVENEGLNITTDYIEPKIKPVYNYYYDDRFDGDVEVIIDPLEYLKANTNEVMELFLNQTI